MYGVEPRPMPKSTRPLLSASSVATRSAIANGLLIVIRMTENPSRIRFVRWLIAASSMSGHGLWPISRKKCCSVIQKVS